MEMESARRSFDRSREPQQQPGLKKPRLAAAEEPSLPNPNGRPFASRQAAALARLRAERDSETNDSTRSGGGGGYHPQQPHLYQELVSQYKTALAELTFNSKPIITNLTIIAGENLHAAKPIAATICANILEVPSEQKLPSLYLLDSIVKNIGRDYIKYFAARLPEVFCKAYRQVDSSVHQSMRHLFGTWKGVFPPQPLQMIGRELGFTPAANGSSSGTTTSKPDSQSQRPPHSIHINPKYLERQHLHQAGRAKGVVDDVIGPMANSTEDVERPDRAVSIGAGRTWPDPGVKVPNIQHSHREVLSEPVLEKKKIGVVYGDYEYGSDVGRTSGFGVGKISGRVSEQGHDKPWMGAGSGVTETISGQRNGFTMKHGFPNYPTSKSNVDLHLQPTQSTVRRNASGTSTSWKNSEEEEFMWEMHSRVSEQDEAIRPTNAREDRWPPDDSQKLEVENILQKLPTSHMSVSRFDREPSSESSEQKESTSFGHRLSSPWRLQESPSNDVLSGTEGYSANTGASLTNGSSLANMAVRPHMISSHMGTAGFGFLENASSGSTGSLGKQRFQALGAAGPSEQSSKNQHSPSPVHLPHQQFQSSVEQDFRRSQMLLQPDYKAPQVSGNLLPRHGNLKKLRPEGQQSAAASAPSQSSLHYPSLPKQADAKVGLPGQRPPASVVSSTKNTASFASDHLNLLSVESTSRSSTSSLLAAVVKAGILSNITTGGLSSQTLQDVNQIPSQPSIKPPLPSGDPTQILSSGPAVTAVSSSSSLLVDSSKAAVDVSRSKEDQRPLPLGLKPSSAQIPSAASKETNPLSNLLSSLVAKGLISSKSEVPTALPKQMPTQSQNSKPDAATRSSSPVSSAVPHSSTGDEESISEADEKSAVSLPQPENVVIDNLIGLDFKSEIIRELHPPVISALFDDLPHECSICGLKLKLKERLDRHLQWHSWKKSEQDGIGRVTRRWYADSGKWVAGKAGLLVEPESSCLKDGVGQMIDENEQMTSADEDQCVCVICGELFEDYYSQERNKWMFKGAVRMTIISQDGEMGTSNVSAKGPIVHASCASQNSFHEARCIKMVRHFNILKFFR
ncbi:hypothetical protein Tsubulata_002984 [Turnera subulata]|uniref:CID domain-containing protein n=1 Tax=Turnera subulata TaxID=218843 RepID=A0A9Q0GE59_9ROSI|nr:hypothetical protein Tsubulata_002984 [Turnera subulata]